MYNTSLKSIEGFRKYESLIWPFKSINVNAIYIRDSRCACKSVVYEVCQYLWKGSKDICRTWIIHVSKVSLKWIKVSKLTLCMVVVYNVLDIKFYQDLLEKGQM
jgi:hypothetical protein